ncbi:3-oxoacyl-ACP synthase III family protein [Pseudoramibacter alactolyticus]|uniref:3-oxoacyl-ACP synthase III family protein n=1 Tax=Pseudoramibacter alactolyticus TaxID=113287 RepID=UPI0028ED54F3|nr:3-oxoacyl-ACP synthase III family protein [Pseudoramibacter alactolyticus]
MTSIIGTGSFCPPVVKDEAFIKKYGKKAVAAGRLLAHHEHYQATVPDTGERLHSNLDMAEEASRRAILSAGLDPNNVDMIIYSSCSPEMLLPPSFALLQKRMGIDRCAGVDIRSGCAGFGTALTVADAAVKTGKANRVLVVGADAISSRFTMLPAKTAGIKTVFNHMFFGDAAGAVVLADVQDRGILYSEMVSDHADVVSGSSMTIGGSRFPYPNEAVPEDDWAVYQKGGVSEKYLSEALINTLGRLKDRQKVAMDQIDAFIMPIESEKIRQRVLCAFPEIDAHKILSGGEGGALINAAIPLTIDRAVKANQIKENDRVLIYAAENTQWQHAVVIMKW